MEKKTFPLSKVYGLLAGPVVMVTTASKGRQTSYTANGI
jgi:hypothetical protein